MLVIKTTITKMKNAFERPISKLDKAEERISEIEKIYKQKPQKLKNKQKT